MLATSTTLPADVVRIILEAAYLTPDYTLWNEYGRGRRVAWFASTLLVSRTWYIAGQQTLYHRIHIVTQKERSNALLIRTLSRKPHIALMVKVLLVQSYAKCDRRRNHIIQLPTPSIPLITGKGRKKWHKQRQHERLAQLLKLCVRITELSVEEPDLDLITLAMEGTETMIEQLTIKRAYDVSHGQWKRLARSTFWHNLRSIQLSAADPLWGRSFREGIYELREAFLGAKSFNRLERLEIDGVTDAGTLTTIINTVRPTLRTIRCDETEGSLKASLEIVSSTLQNLALTVSQITPLADFSFLTRLEHLTITLLPGGTRRSVSFTLIPLHSIPPSISAFELQIPEDFNPWRAASHVAQVLRAFDFRLLPNLKRLDILVEISGPGQLSSWIPAAFLLDDLVKRHGLEFRLHVRFELRPPDLYQFDCFSRARHEQDVARRRQTADSAEISSWPRAGECVVNGILTAAVHAYFCFCCVMYTSCCCCFLADFFD